MGLQLHLVFMILLAAVAHASWNAIAKSSGDRFLTSTANLGTGLLGIILVPFVPLPDAHSWPYLIAGVLIHAGYHLLLNNAYRFGDLSKVYPLARGSAPVVVTVLAMLIENEVPSPLGFAAVALVFVGMASLSFQGNIKSQDHTKSVFLALTTGLFIASYTVIDGLGIRQNNETYSYIIWLMLLEGVPFTLWAVFRRPHTIMPFLRIEWRRALVGGLLSKFAYGLVLYALSQGAMATVTALRETSVIFAAVIGVVFLGEKMSTARAVSAVVIVAGVVMLQLAG